mmetsp:Transcript_4938/g.4187  ORF Transcript_4938/g.4187 Transcript_4938/m.4187 type:complete len:87 (+) Transcript_4938:348-608(+)
MSVLEEENLFIMNQIQEKEISLEEFKKGQDEVVKVKEAEIDKVHQNSIGDQTVKISNFKIPEPLDEESQLRIDNFMKSILYKVMEI